MSQDEEGSYQPDSDPKRYFRGVVNLALEDDLTRLVKYFRSGRFSTLYLAFPTQTWLKTALSSTGTLGMLVWLNFGSPK